MRDTGVALVSQYRQNQPYPLLSFLYRVLHQYTLLLYPTGK
jgi:hypothetical protein